MRQHEQTTDSTRRAWCWIILGITLALSPIQAWSQAESVDPARSAEPIDLAAGSIRLWNQGADQWLLLQGKVAILQGLEGVRANQAVIRVTRSETPTGATHRLDVYAEGQAQPIGRPVSPLPVYRTTLVTDKNVRFKPYDNKAVAREAGPPKGLAILGRAFPATQRASTPPPIIPLPNARPVKSAAPATESRPEISLAPPSPVTPTTVTRRAAPTAEATEAPRPSSRPVIPVEHLSESMPVTVPASAADVSPATPASLGYPPAQRDGTPGAVGSLPSARPVISDVAPVTEPLPEFAPVPPVVPPAVDASADQAEKIDRVVVPTQFEPEGFDGGSQGDPPGGFPAPAESPEMEDAPSVPNLSPFPLEPPTDLEPLPGPGLEPAPRSPAGGAASPAKPASPTIPIMPGSQRTTRMTSRDGTPYTLQTLPNAGGYSTIIIRGGVNVLTVSPPPMGVIDLSADRVIIWRKMDAKTSTGPNGEQIEDAGDPMEIYLEGHVIIRQDKQVVAGTGDQQTYHAEKAYFNIQSGRLIAVDAQLDMFAPGLIAPTKMFSPRIEQFRPLVPGKNGGMTYGFEEIRADQTMLTGSRFPVPGYRFTSRSVDITHVLSTKTDPNTGQSVGDPRDPRTEPDLTWRIDARRNVFYLGPLPVFYWPRILGNADDIEPPMRQIRYGYNNYLGHQVLADFNGFRLFGIRKPDWIDTWNIDIDYLSMRSKQFPALGSEIGWFGKDFVSDLFDPYRRNKREMDKLGPDGYFGYLDMWGLRDDGIDVLGTGPAIVTPSGDIRLPDGTVPGKRGFQRGISGIPGLPNGVPAFQKFRGRINMRHMQSLLGPDADPYEDFRFQVEAAYVSDRQFLEEYYKRLTETGLDQETLGYAIRQKDNWALSIWTEANLQNFNTETQWLPRLDYYRLGDSPLGNLLTYDQHSGIDYANVHTAVEVNNPNIFAFMPYDPISNTSGVFRSGRAFTSHELDMPLNFDNIFRVVPYVQGQAVGWDNQISGTAVGRIWGAAGARADIMAWKRYPDIESDLFNVHGLNHKVNFQADYRNAYSNVNLNELGIQDDLDDNTYEFVRRYFALFQYHGGLLPPQYDPRHLILRRGISPITGTTDVQGTIQTLQLNMHSRLQTKRGPEGKRRIMDFMTFDLSTTYFPYAQRDNFGKAFGQNTYNWQWFLGDRTSLVSYGWFEFFDIGGKPKFQPNKNLAEDPFGLNVITSGISISRPPRGNIFIGYTILDSGQITTSALNPSVSYWMSPKWYGTFSTSYDFGNAIWLSSMFSFTRVGADYLTTIGLVVDPQRNNFSQLAIAISPRLSPGIRLGSGSGLNQFDSRYAPTQ
ncbi:LPS-assembly protein LptD [Singulisphaera acidiphila]|uniref:Organic solvent tolerance protein OstA n=1 Tax=Singulisphaera acidiphila (strain ATCC BAA-1392 / DSM 18658 / VKM B-2454 / MOB10) TaxID=886293 RepID=L0DEI8_SINAD|nr:hypothetical protein [Singulisphaera acidiphila]AGA27270.1 hypothetical protein Sinac_2987 [Singulisphaera acidiphila DSM 18658]